MLKRHLITAIFLAATFNGFAQDALTDCKAALAKDTLTIENENISRKFLWNKGYLISTSITDKKANYKWQLKNDKPDNFFPGEASPSNGTLEVKKEAATSISPAHLKVEVTVSLGTFQVKRVFRVYPKSPAIACDYYIKGEVAAPWSSQKVNAGDLRNIETHAAVTEGDFKATVIERLKLQGRNWKTKAVQFFDITDRNNNLVNERSQFVYRGESHLPGNLLFITSQLNDHGLFLLKEAPTSEAQINYPGFDFTHRVGEISTVGVGIDSKEVQKDVWTRCYGVVLGVSNSNEYAQITALRKYQSNIRLHDKQRDHMIMLNTWGDRNQDKSVGEVFALNEIEAAKKLGITHFQIDDGWQLGKSGNSAFAGGSFKNMWDNPNYWEPDKAKFPNGLEKVISAGKNAGIEVCLWFNPSKDNDYADWRKDAAAMIKLNKVYGVRTFKIDGVQVSNKACEVNLRKMLDTVMLATNNQAVFNLDVTAGKRYGYHYFNEYGNIFLENRYTDYGNYYPHWTLRNLWMLAKYVPAQNLQIEFLNHNRNKDKYPDDELAPANFSFEYLFATTMMAQPLAWFEASGLPEEAFKIAPVVKSYQKLQANIHEGQIFPIGNEPNGISWTGFQSDYGKTGYFMVYREKNNEPSYALNTWLEKNTKLKLTLMLGQGQNFNTITAQNGQITFKLANPNSYALYKYEIQ